MSTPGRLVVFVLATTGAFVYICNAIPQIETTPVVVETAIGESPADLVAAGREIFNSDRAQCLTCHSVGEDPRARCPDQEGLGERAARSAPGVAAPAYLVESVYNPDAYVVPGYPRNQMTPVHLPPIALSHDEVLAILAFLNTLGGITDADFVDQLRRAQEPWRQGRLRPEGSTERARLPVFRGAAGRGDQVFGKLGCIQCHRLGELGRDVGPSLVGIGASQSAEYLLEAVLDPNAVIVRGYKNTIVYWKERGRPNVRGTPLAWIPHKDTPRAVLLSVPGPNEAIETQIDLDDVAQIGDTTMRVLVDGEARSLCGEHVEGDKEAGVTLRLLEGGRWVERSFAPEAIEFVNLPTSPMPSNYGDLATPREIYDLVAFLGEQ